MNDSQAQQEKAPVTVLGFDTSTASLAAAIVRGGAVIGSVHSLAERNHSVLIVQEIKRLMAECGMTPRDLDAIGVGRGPGSYTGVRIAVSVGKTLAWAWDKTLLGVSSLEALAFGAWESEAAADAIRGEADAEGADRPAWIVPVMDARRGQAYTSRFAAYAGGRWERLDDDGIRLSSDWIGMLRNEAEALVVKPIIRLVGDGDFVAALCGAADNGNEAAGARLRGVPSAMDAGAVGKLASARYARGEKDDIHRFVPNYTQLAEAEAKLLAASRRD